MWSYSNRFGRSVSNGLLLPRSLLDIFPLDILLLIHVALLILGFVLHCLVLIHQLTIFINLSRLLYDNLLNNFWLPNLVLHDDLSLRFGLSNWLSIGELYRLLWLIGKCNGWLSVWIVLLLITVADGSLLRSRFEQSLWGNLLGHLDNCNLCHISSTVLDILLCCCVGCFDLNHLASYIGRFYDCNFFSYFFGALLNNRLRLSDDLSILSGWSSMGQSSE